MEALGIKRRGSNVWVFRSRPISLKRRGGVVRGWWLSTLGMRNASVWTNAGFLGFARCTRRWLRWSSPARIQNR